MRNSIQTLRHYLGVNGLYRRAHIIAAYRPAWLLRLGVPLALAAVSTLGWYASTAKPTTATAAAQVPTTSAKETPADTAIDTKLEATQSTSSDGPISDTSLTINSEPVPLPNNGSVHKVIQDDTGTTTVDVSVDSQTSGTSENNTTMKLEINSRSTTDSEQSSTTNEGP